MSIIKEEKMIILGWVISVFTGIFAIGILLVMIIESIRKKMGEKIAFIDPISELLVGFLFLVALTVLSNPILGPLILNLLTKQ